VQSSGTAWIATAFGPVMVMWFSVLTVMGLVPSAMTFRARGDQSRTGFSFCFRTARIGLVTRVRYSSPVTGGEALYADLGHFGRKPIQSAWFFWCCRRC